MPPQHDLSASPAADATAARSPFRRLLLGPAGPFVLSLCGAALLALITAACSSDDRPAATGEAMFTTPFPDTNGRSCATCHVAADNFALSATHAQQVWEANPNDPLFSAVDADDPTAEVLTYEHVKKGLIRVWLTLPMTMDVIDDDGNVITPADRKIWVWRGVPSIADVALTAPYQLDGREAALDSQAQGAVTGHSEGGTIAAEDLAKIAEFEQSVFTSDRAKTAAEQVAAGTDPASITDADNSLELTEAETRGQLVYTQTCAACHGGASTNIVIDRDIHAQAFPALNDDGTAQFPLTNGDPAIAFSTTAGEFINIGTVNENYMAQAGKELGFRMTEHVAYTEDLSYPQYRFRFYKDETQQEVIAELPQPVGDVLAAAGAAPPADGTADTGDAAGPDGADFGDGAAPALPLSFSTDPGRAAITGNPIDFEAFDVPSLRGVAKTAPYWHNNISETLEAVVDLYSDHLLANFPALTINDAPPQVDADGDIGPIEALSEQQKADLVAYLRRL